MARPFVRSAASSSRCAAPARRTCRERLHPRHFHDLSLKFGVGPSALGLLGQAEQPECGRTMLGVCDREMLARAVGRVDPQEQIDLAGRFAYLALHLLAQYEESLSVG